MKARSEQMVVAYALERLKDYSGVMLARKTGKYTAREWNGFKMKKSICFEDATIFLEAFFNLKIQPLFALYRTKGKVYKSGVFLFDFFETTQDKNVLVSKVREQFNSPYPFVIHITEQTSKKNKAKGVFLLVEKHDWSVCKTIICDNKI